MIDISEIVKCIGVVYNMDIRDGRSTARPRSSDRPALRTSAESRDEHRAVELEEKAPRSAPVRRKKSPAKFTIIVIAVALIAVVLGSWFAYKSLAGSASAIDSAKYQAVFFTNGQVYFGKLHELDRGYYRLSDIYYLQTKTGEKNNSGNPQSASSQDAANVELIKLGSEVHGPEDEMIINRDQVLFFENLKSDGKVTSTISKYSKQ